ncbi:hypothetical protein RCCGEPOP_08982 [Rhizobium sp. Pop5]|nr:hypothetical protein RCCGEPOP_08982 [Rhizobium sp. Pop5]
MLSEQRISVFGVAASFNSGVSHSIAQGAFAAEDGSSAGLPCTAATATEQAARRMTADTVHLDNIKPHLQMWLLLPRSARERKKIAQRSK